MPKLTLRFVQSLDSRPEKGKVIYFRDDELQGFGLMVREKSISYFAEKRINGKSRRVTIGKHPLWSPESARKEAMKILGMLSSGVDPVKTRDIRKTAEITLSQAFEEYMSSKEFRRNTILSFNRVMIQNLGDWQRKSVTSITRQMVEERFRELSSGSKLGTSGKANANLTMQVLRATLNYISLKYEVDGEPLLPVNPVSRLTQLRSWHRLPQRQGVIPDHKLAAFYSAVMSLENQTARDYYLVLLLTGLRRNEAPRLRWSDIDLEAKTMTVRAEVSKGGREYRLPLSDFLVEIFSRRLSERGDSEYVFAGRQGQGRYWGGYHTVELLRERAGCYFSIHDLRRTFLTIAERLDTPHYALKKLAGHSMREDITAAYLVIDVERLREPMQRITDHIRSQIFAEDPSAISAS